tara:strand:- start:35276 stop:36694 length:1419 start_codon:yes stop_codon:yes gene_type:complete
MKSYIYIIACILFSCIGCRNSDEKKAIAQEMPAVNETKKPNVIVILIDDAGYIDFGFMGSKDLPTPEIDKLAESGTVFTDAHVTATVCAPSRAGLMTGQYQQRIGFEANGTGGIGLSDNSVTMANVFQDNGYRTYALGKWHLGEDESDHPNQRGFDDFYGFLSGGRSYFPINNPSKDKMLQHNGERVVFDGYMTDVLGEQSAKFVTESAKNKEPFFMYLAYNAVHTPMEAKEKDLKRFEGHSRQTLAAMTWSLDENVGKLRKALEAVGELENSLIFFLSDNGGAHNNDSKTGPLKGWKGNKFEGGHRIPFIVSWPNQIKSNQMFDGLTSSLDIFKTATEVVGLETPKSHILDGVNLLPFLKGDKTGDPHEQLFWRKLEESAARVGDYKLIGLDGFGTVLYNVENDLGEVNDLSKDEKQKSNELLASYQIWEKDMKKPLWDEGEKWMKVTYHIQKSLMQNKEPLYKAPGGIRE